MNVGPEFGLSGPESSPTAHGRARAEPLLQSPCALARACGFAALAAAPEATWLARSQAAARMATGRAAGPRVGGPAATARATT